MIMSLVHSSATMRLALRRSVLDQLLRMHLAPMHFDAGKGPVGTLGAHGSLDHLKPRASIHHPLDQAEVATGHELTRPHLDYETFQSQFGSPVEFDQLLQLVPQRHRVFGPSILGPEQLLH